MYYSNMNIEHHIMETQAFLRPCRVIIASCADWIIGYNQQYFVKSRAHGMGEKVMGKMKNYFVLLAWNLETIKMPKYTQKSSSLKGLSRS